MRPVRYAVVVTASLAGCTPSGPESAGTPALTTTQRTIIELDPEFFSPGSSIINPSYERALDRVLAPIPRGALLRVEVACSATHHATEESRWLLSTGRVNALEQLLTKRSFHVIERSATIVPEPYGRPAVRRFVITVLSNDER